MNLNVPARYLDDQKQKNDEAIGKLLRFKTDTENRTYRIKLIAQELTSNEAAQRYNLRSREDLNVPSTCLDDQKQKNNEAIGQLKRKISA